MLSFKSLIKKTMVTSGLLKGISVVGNHVAVLRYHSVHPEPQIFDDRIGITIMHSQKSFKNQMEVIYISIVHQSYYCYICIECECKWVHLLFFPHGQFNRAYSTTNEIF